jgi:hypothetical protein
VLPVNIPLLGSLRQLRSLRPMAEGWSDTDVRTLGELRLPHLESIDLISATTCVYDEEPIGGGLVCASFSPLTVEGGLRYLLQLPALTHVKLPWVAPDALACLRHLQSVSTHAAGPIRFETPDPPPSCMLPRLWSKSHPSLHLGPSAHGPLDVHQPDHFYCCCYSGGC